MGELICTARFDDKRTLVYEKKNADPIIDGQSYCVEKEISDKVISIVLFNTKGNQKTKIDHVDYQNIGEEYESPFLSWYNLFFCSAHYNAGTDDVYMNKAVQKGLKTAATLGLSANEIRMKQLVKRLPLDCGWLPYNGLIYVYHKGSLGDYFDFDKVRFLYKEHGIHCVDWAAIKDYFQKDMSFWGNEEKCGFSLQGGGGTEQKIIKGLVLGYPLESTVRIVKPRLF